MHGCVFVSNLLENMNLLHPTLADAAALWDCVRECPPLEPNSPYAYALICSHFANTSVVARDDAGIAGFIAGYCPPERPDAVFVWQIGVQPRARGKSLGIRMLDFLTGGENTSRVRYVEATVAPSNAASRRMFEAFARTHSAQCTCTPHFEPSVFGGGTHEAEHLLRIGPLVRPQLRNGGMQTHDSQRTGTTSTHGAS